MLLGWSCCWDGLGGDAAGGELDRPGTHVLGQDLDHPHRPELGHEVLVDLVALPGGQLDHVMGQPDLLHVSPERHPAAGRVPDLPPGELGLGPVPGLVGALPVAEAPGRTLPPLDIPVVGGAAQLAVSRNWPAREQERGPYAPISMTSEPLHSRCSRFMSCISKPHPDKQHPLPGTSGPARRAG